ncbi:MerR family transcriptional regulator [Sinanaerobacter chloroacetimidivorans]|uniref:MerR family transcriptional regulator n=1 Tax=Sinanaerobacter chloroacetimidivorans TaxID=2818044 RepID=A0A8J7W7D8_9FIRM|nr:MerR family transcriptional regulator [Sinanaerobacter chloroacetimidivorans]MBR0600480.1 MerR family transcriptional regulator [Sinanaerobacter chloroacetimidivorans]
MKNESTAGLMKIGELAKATGTNVSTIKFYVKEGLIQAACKTGPNMAYYHADCIARVQLIKSLQKERYYPLSVIKHMLDTSNPNHMELELLDAISKVDYKSSSKTFSPSEAIKMTRLSKDHITVLDEKKLLKPEFSGKKLRYTEADLQVMLLIRRRMDASIPFSESVASFEIYEQALKHAAKADVDLFINRALLASAPSTEDAVRMICVSDETLDLFVSLKRKEWNREFGSERIGDLDRYSSNLTAMLQSISKSLEELEYKEPAKQCRDAILYCPEGTGPVAAALKYYHLVITSTSGSLAKSIAICGQAHTYFTSLDFEKSEGIDSLLLYSLHLGWLFLAPSLLDCTEEAKKSADSFNSYASDCIGTKSESYTQQILSAITRIGGIS